MQLAPSAMTGICMYYSDAYYIKHMNFTNLFINSIHFHIYEVVYLYIILLPGGNLSNHLFEVGH